MIRVLIVDDSLFMRTLIRDMLKTDPEIEVIGSAADGLIAREMIEDLMPDVITLDIEMPRMDGLELLGLRRSFRHFPKTIMLSSLTVKGGEATNRAIRLGADDFLLKPHGIENVRALQDELVAKIKNVMRIPYIEQLAAPSREIATDVVLIGSSAGGPPMLDTVISSLHHRLDAAIVIVQHMPEGGFTAALATRLNRISIMPVKETETGDLLTTGQVFIAKAGYHTVITPIPSSRIKRAGKVVHSRSPQVHGVRPAADRTFTSASQVFGHHIVSVILSGMGNDGGAGMADIKRMGGATIVAREGDCLVYGMARSALQCNCVDQVLPLSAIAREIERLVPRGSRNV